MMRAIGLGMVVGLFGCDLVSRTDDFEPDDGAAHDGASDDSAPDPGDDEEEPAPDPDPETMPDPGPLPPRAAPPPLEGPCEEPGTQVACIDDELHGVQFCDDYELTWGPCLGETECEPDDTRVEECPGGEHELSCVLTHGVPEWEECSFTPLVVSFDGREPTFDAAPDAFELSAGSGACFARQMPTADTPWLALDLDLNGAIDNGSELFGSASPMPGSAPAPAPDGFAALAVHDANGDHRITAADPIWPRLLLWSDLDGDRRSSPAELTPLTASPLTAIELGSTKARLCDASRNCAIERAPAATTFGPATIIDLHIPCD